MHETPDCLQSSRKSVSTRTSDQEPIGLRFRRTNKKNNNRCSPHWTAIYHKTQVDRSVKEKKGGVRKRKMNLCLERNISWRFRDLTFVLNKGKHCLRNLEDLQEMGRMKKEDESIQLRRKPPLFSVFTNKTIGRTQKKSHYFSWSSVQTSLNYSAQGIVEIPK